MILSRVLNVSVCVSLGNSRFAVTKNFVDRGGKKRGGGWGAERGRGPRAGAGRLHLQLFENLRPRS